MKKTFIRILAILIIIQPFLNLYMIVNNPSFSIAGIHLTTIIRYGLIALIGLYLLVAHKYKENRKLLIFYGILIFIYTLLHHINASDFYTLIPGGIEYSFFEELLYIVRYMVPIFLTYAICTENISKNTFDKILLTFSFIMSITIVLTNLTYISYSSYMDIKITQNILDWFSQDVSYLYASSRGLFYSSIVITTLTLITPYFFSRYYKTNRKVFLFAIILNMLSLFMCGTKACTFGAIIIAVIMTLMYIFFCFIRKELRFNKWVLLMSLILIISPISILKFTPALSRMALSDEVEEIDEDGKEYEEFKQLESITDPSTRKKIIINFFSENIDIVGFEKTFLEEKYPYRYDYEFWLETYVNNAPIERQDNRHIEELMLKRVKEINNNFGDDLLGLTYSRTSRIYNLESDFKYQYYSMGLIGLILLMGPLIVILVAGIILTLKRDFNIENTSLCFGIALLYAVAYTSGNMLDNLSILIVLGLVTGYLLSKLKKKKPLPGTKDNKVTIIMPTYNDCESITETLDSIIEQTYPNWELLISDDGSTDDTKKIVNNYIKEHKEARIKYYYHSNQDQLNAILNVLDNATGNYIHILHSDDKFHNKYVLEKVNEDLRHEPSDVLFSNHLVTMNEQSKVTGILEYPDYVNKDYILATQLLWLGRQYYCDVAFFKKDIYQKYVKYNYLTWNTPYWLNYKDEPSMLNVRTVDYPFFNYRVFEGNYINNEIGQLNVISGELRTAIRLLKYYDIPKYNIQYLVFRTFNKLGLRDFFRPIYKKQESNNKASIVKFIINKRYTDEEINKYPHLKALVKFFENYQDRTIEIKDIDKDEKIYQGKDMRAFNKLIVKDEISDLYKQVFKEMEKGFNCIETTEENKTKVEDIVKFLNMYPFVEVKVNEQKKNKKNK